MQRPRKNQKSQPHLALIDTNVFVYKTHMLRSPLGASFLYSAKQKSRQILLPEVVELEIKENFRIAYQSAFDKAQSALRNLRDASGLKIGIDLTSAPNWEALFKDRVEDLDSLFVRLPLTPQVAKQAIVRVAEKKPPSRNGQQFKDCAIWFSALQAASEHDVAIITEDTGFFENDDPTKGLAKILLSDAAGARGKIEIFHGLDPYLERYAVVAPPLKPTRVRHLVESEARGQLEWLFREQRFDLGELISQEARPYLTDEPDYVAYSFSCVFRVRLYVDDGTDESLPGTLRCVGEFLYEPHQDSVDDAYLLYITTHDESGRQLTSWRYDGKPQHPEPAELLHRARHPLDRRPGGRRAPQ